MLAAASLGAVWTAISPDTGSSAVLERLEQLHPCVLFVDTAVKYNGKIHDNIVKARSVVEGLPSLRRVVVNDIFTTLKSTTNGVTGEQQVGIGDKSILFTEFLQIAEGKKFSGYSQLQSDHPVFVLFSSGTTGSECSIVTFSMFVSI